jgi:hypothetical protein
VFFVKWLVFCTIYASTLRERTQDAKSHTMMNEASFTMHNETQSTVHRKAHASERFESVIAHAHLNAHSHDPKFHTFVRATSSRGIAQCEK